MADENRPRLGRGLAALLGESAHEAASSARAPQRIPIEFLRPNARNPRTYFDEDALEELAASIREKGLIQPIVVRSVNSVPGHYEIIVGERRWRASQKAGLVDIPVVILNVTDRESLELAIIENVQRADLNQLEEARGYAQLMNEFQHTQLDLSKIIGKSRSHVANILRLLQLPVSIQEMLQSGSITAGHARALLSISNSEEVAKKVVKDRLTVRDLEKYAREQGNQPEKDIAPSQATERKLDVNILDLERSISEILGMRVRVQHQGESGILKISYSNVEQLDLICDLLRRGRNL